MLFKLENGMLMVTKAEVESNLSALQQQFDLFRKNVVKEALKAAKENDWCDVVQNTLTKCGLGDLLPPRFVIQRRNTSRQKWYDVDYYDNVEEAVEDAKENRNQHNTYATYIGEKINSLTVAAAVQKKLDDAVRDLKSKVIYPQFRVVKRYNSQDTVV